MAESLNPERNGADGPGLIAEGEGRTVSEAEANALEKLEAVAGPIGVSDVEISVLSEGSKGFLGVGSSLARVEVRLKGAEAEPPAAAGARGPEPPAAGGAAARLQDYLGIVVAAFGLDASVSVADEGETLVGKVDGDGLGIFIGRHGQTIDAVQYLANIIVYRGLPGRKRVVVDAEDYRERRVEALEAMAERGAVEVLEGGARYEMKPMNPSERRIVHMYLQGRDGVETISEGEEPFRRVVITRSGNTA